MAIMVALLPTPWRERGLVLTYVSLQDLTPILDGNLGVYIVVGLQDYYYYDNNYYRYDRDRWYYSNELDRNWRDYNESKLPPGLAKKYGHGNNRKVKISIKVTLIGKDHLVGRAGVNSKLQCRAGIYLGLDPNTFSVLF